MDFNSLKYLFTILSSYLMNYYYKAHYTDVNVKPVYLEKLPIPNITFEAQQPFIALADIMLEKNKELQEVRTKFMNFFTEKFSINKPTTKLQNWYEITFTEFLKEIKKFKVSLSLQDEMSWQELFEQQKILALELKTLIEQTDKKIDAMVYELYGLTEDEIKIVEGE